MWGWPSHLQGAQLVIKALKIRGGWPSRLYGGPCDFSVRPVPIGPWIYDCLGIGIGIGIEIRPKGIGLGTGA